MEKKVFEELFENYLQNNLSEAEEKKLMEIIQEGIYDDFIKEKIQLLLKENDNVELDKQKGDDILQFILSQSESDIKTKVIPISRKENSRKIRRALIAIAATVLIFFAVKNALVYNQKTVPVITKGNETEEVNPVLAYHGKQLIHLPDGSTILLNDNSSIEYNQNEFDTKTREVTLSGEAYFDIQRNEKKPFIVHTGKVRTQVLGTAFNIKAKSNTDEVEVTVERGKVQVGDLKKVYGVITPNQQIKVNTNTLVYEQNQVNAVIVMEWKSKYLILDNINMEEAISLISQKYKVPITLSNEKIKNCRITASFLNDEDLDHILKVICSVIETEYRYTENGAVVLKGNGCE
ncbi:FecR family protein [Flavobacterium sp. MR2016-29]|uniref:FecR family protein n=1 Tax=Flavobacterium sp. MR2016-29 TaxID=2783795 RepID=UPI00188BF3C0|nr:FecR domain-containing protein [Flavobacterium sp. MR2016-29]MBF4494171.1 FecR family protein [Flavobacterium sp. MR2016-29]